MTNLIFPPSPQLRIETFGTNKANVQAKFWKLLSIWK
jgi:hypothetical protein